MPSCWAHSETRYSSSIQRTRRSASRIVDRLTLFDFQSLPEGRTRVRQFDLDNTRCDSIGRILINGVAACDGEGLAGPECIDRLTLASRTKAEIAG